MECWLWWAGRDFSRVCQVLLLIFRSSEPYQVLYRHWDRKDFDGVARLCFAVGLRRAVVIFHSLQSHQCTAWKDLATFFDCHLSPVGEMIAWLQMSFPAWMSLWMDFDQFAVITVIRCFLRWYRFFPWNTHMTASRCTLGQPRELGPSLASFADQRGSPSPRVGQSSTNFASREVCASSDCSCWRASCFSGCLYLSPVSFGCVTGQSPYLGWTAARHFRPSKAIRQPFARCSHRLRSRPPST